MCSGVTSVLSLGGPSLEYNTRELAATLEDAPTVFIGHGVIGHAPRFVAERMIPPWDGELTLKPVVSEEEGVAEVREAVARGADLVKTAVDDRGSALLAAAMWWWDWRELEAAIVKEAARHGLMVTTHAHALDYARGLVELGVASLQHIPADKPVDDAFIELAREKGVIVVPTLGLRKRDVHRTLHEGDRFAPHRGALFGARRRGVVVRAATADGRRFNALSGAG